MLFTKQNGKKIISCINPCRCHVQSHVVLFLTNLLARKIFTKPLEFLNISLDILIIHFWIFTSGLVRIILGSIKEIFTAAILCLLLYLFTLCSLKSLFKESQ